MQPYTDGKTKILLSFAMANYGFVFATDLRDKLMRFFHFYSPTAIYQDNVTMRLAKKLQAVDNAYKGKLPADKDLKADTTYLLPDWRNPATGYIPIGARNRDWNKYYTKAMAQAPVMLMVVTPEYMDNVNCMTEWAQFEKEKGRRGGKFRGIVLAFAEDKLDLVAKPINSPHVEVFWGKRVHGPTRGLASNFGPRAWTLREDNFLELAQIIQPYLRQGV